MPSAQRNRHSKLVGRLHTAEQEKKIALQGCWCCWLVGGDGLDRFVAGPANAVFWHAHVA